MKKLVQFMFLALLFTKPAFSQIDNFDYIDENAVKQFAKPLVTSLGAAMNSGSYHSAHVSKLFGFSIGVKAMMMMIPDDQKRFTPDLPTGYKSITADNSTATIFGDAGGIYTGPLGFYTYPNGLNQSSVPFAVPQATLSLLGTELLVRYAPINLKDTKINLLGLGLKHSISQYIPLIPVDIAVQVLYNKLDIDNLFTSTHLAFNAEVSKKFSILTLYGGVQSEKSKVTFGYTTTADPTSANPLLQTAHTVSAEMEGENKMRVTAGLTLGLGFFVLNADYSLGSQAVASAGLTFEF